MLTNDQCARLLCVFCTKVFIARWKCVGLTLLKPLRNSWEGTSSFLQHFVQQAKISQHAQPTTQASQTDGSSRPDWNSSKTPLLKHLGRS